MKMQLFHYKTGLIFLAQPEMSHDRVYTLVQCARKNWNVESKLKSFLGILPTVIFSTFFPLLLKTPFYPNRIPGTYIKHETVKDTLNTQNKAFFVTYSLINVVSFRTSDLDGLCCFFTRVNQQR